MWIELTRLLLLVAVGLAFEVVFTALMDYPKTKDRRLIGYTYVWMVPIYAIVYPALYLLYGRIAAWPFWLRGCFYATTIIIIEYISGWLLRKLTGECPWERNYYTSRWGVHGLIRLDYFPAWFAAALMFEWIYRVLRGIV